MDRGLSQVVLRDGSAVELRLVMPPEPAWAEPIDQFLRHKGMPWQIHWLDAFAGRTDELVARFYLMLAGGQPVSHIMTVEFGGIGILGHVFTKPDWRGKGAASVLMKTVRDDFSQRDGLILYLGTVHDSMPWHLYRKFGFEGFLPGTGLMRWVRQPDRLREKFAGARRMARELRWRDWPSLHHLFVQSGDDYVRNMSLKRFGPSDMEGPFLTLQERMRKGPPARASVLVNEEDMVLGLATATPLDAHLTDYVLVDLFVHRDAEDDLPKLWRALDLPADQPVLSVVESNADSGRRRAMESVGFRAAGCLPGALNADASKEDLVLMMRAATGSEG